MIFLYVLLGLVALLLLLFVLLLVPARLVITYHGKPKTEIRYLFFRFDVKELIERFGSDDGNGAEQSKPKTLPKNSAKQKKGDLLGFISFIGKVTQTIALAVKEQLERSKVYLKEFTLVLGTDDAAKTAMLFGAATTAANSLCAVLGRFTRLYCNNDRLLIAPDFSSDKTTFSVHLELHFRFLHLIGVILRAQSRLFDRKDVHHARNSIKASH